MDLERAMEFLLEQQAASQARADARAVEQQTRFDAQMTSITVKLDRVAEQQEKTQLQANRTEAALRRAIELSVIEHRRERTRRRDGDAKLAEADARFAEADTKLSQKMAELATEQALTQASLRAFIDSLKRPGNGHDKV